MVMTVDELDIARLTTESGRAESTIRRWMRFDGLPFRYSGRKVVVTREDWDEWRSRPEIALMIAMGSHIKEGIGRQRAKAF